jgi:hypothetical protein
MSPESEGYDLQRSKKAVSELYPVIKDAHGNVIDGFHRLDADPNWKTETIATITTPLQLALARIVANTHRRSVSKEERKLQLVTVAEELVKEGVAKEQVIPTMVELTTFSEDYLRRMLPDEYKKRPGVGGGAHESVGLSPTHEHVPDDSGVECRICHRPLTAPESVKNGVGPVCAEGKPATASAPQPKPSLIDRARVTVNNIRKLAPEGDIDAKNVGRIVASQLNISNAEGEDLVKQILKEEAEPKEYQEPTLDAEHLAEMEPVEVRVDLIVINADGSDGPVQQAAITIPAGGKLDIRCDGDLVHTATPFEEAD